MNQPSKSKSPLFWVVLILALLSLPVLACAGCIGLAFFGASALIKSSEPYQTALQEVRNDSEAVEILGEPIEPGMMFQGNINLSNDEGNAAFNFPVTGPKGSGRVYVKGTRAGGEWTYTEMRLSIDSKGGESRDLLADESAEPGSP